MIGRVDGIEDTDLIDWYGDDASRPAMPAAGSRTVLFLCGPVERRVGRIRFEVLTDAVDASSPARLDAASVVDDDAGLATAERGGRARLHGVVRRALAPGAPRPETLGLTVGTADAGAWDANDPKSMDELIELGPACAGEMLIARIVSPERSSGWWIQLREIVRDDRGVRLVVEAWADYGLRDFDAPADVHRPPSAQPREPRTMAPLGARFARPQPPVAERGAVDQ